MNFAVSLFPVIPLSKTMYSSDGLPLSSILPHFRHKYHFFTKY